MKTLKVATLAAFSAMVTEDLLALGSQQKKEIHIALPGGRSAKAILDGILAAKEVVPQVVLYLVDERLTGERNADTLLDAGLQRAIDAQRMDRSQLRIPAIGEPLGSASFDRVYVGIGEDGHFASLFPGSYTQEDQDAVLSIEDSPKPPPKRTTLSYSGFRTLAKKSPIYLLFFGEGKREALERLVANKEGATALPVAFFRDEGFDATIVTDLEDF